MDVVSSGLLDACGCGAIGVLIDSALELLQELVNVEEVALGSQVRQRQRVGVVHRWMRRLGDHCATVTVLGHTGRLVATEDGELNTLETHQALADIVVGGGVDSATLSITEELIESVISSSLTDFVIVGQLLCLIDSVVDWAIGRVLRRAAIKSSRGASRMLLAVASATTKSAVRILISARCSSKSLQVSDDCGTG